MSLADLRARTKPLHDRLDSNLQILETIRTLEQYRAHLLRFYGMLFYVEKNTLRFFEWKDLGIDWLDRERSSLLRADLLALGCNEASLCPPPLPADLPPMGSFAESVGSLYVIEGSTLGAQHLSRHFAEKFGLTKDSGLAFYIGYGKETGARWKEFSLALERFFEKNPGEKENTLAAACAAFAAVEKNLCGPTTPTESRDP